MADVTIVAQFTPTESFSVVTTGGGGDSSAWTAGAVYATPEEVVAKLNADLTGHVAFAYNRTTGKITVSWPVSPNTLAWNSSELQDYLGFDDAVITHEHGNNDDPPLGWWHGAVATPWGSARVYEMDDVPSAYGRTVASQDTGQRDKGSIRLWLHRRQDADFAAAVEDAYVVADEWVANPLTLTDDDDNERAMVIMDGWEFSPESIDEDTVTLDLEAVSWPA